VIDDTRPVLLDNTVLTNFALINRSRLVFDLWGEACTTTAVVLAEYQKAVKQGLLPADVWQELRVLTLTLNEKTLADQ
jgi:hypothetical protein